MITRGQAGFTLLETLVALVVLGFLMAGLTQGLRFGVQASERQAAIIGARADLEAVDRVLRHLIEQIEPGSNLVPGRIAGGAANLAITTRLPAAYTASPRQVDALIMVDERRRLVLQWTPFLHATRLAAANLPAVAELLQGVERLEIAYWNGREWHKEWKGPALPDLIRVRLVFAAGDSRRWPPLIAAPQRGQPT